MFEFDFEKLHCPLPIKELKNSLNAVWNYSNEVNLCYT